MANDLGCGIFLEDIDTVLPWGSEIRELLNIADPVLQESKDRVRLFWNDHLIFGGIRSQVEAVFYRDRPDLHDYPNANGNLHIVTLNFDDIDKLEPREKYEQLKIGFIQALGMPSFERKVEMTSFERPLTEWDSKHALVVLMLFERFGEYCIGEIWHKPLPASRKPKSISKSA